MYYLKFCCELNHIKSFWYYGKSLTRRYCKYILDGLRKIVLQALSQIKHSTILRHYKLYLKKIDLYMEKVVYRTREWKKLTFHKKTWGMNDDR